MLSKLCIENFKAIRHAEVPLGPFQLIVGANGTGKSTLLQALANLQKLPHLEGNQSFGSTAPIRIMGSWGPPFEGWEVGAFWSPSPRILVRRPEEEKPSERDPNWARLEQHLPGLAQQIQSIRVFSLAGEEIAKPVRLTPEVELQPSGANLAGVLDRLRDSHPERFEALNRELGRLLPEFDHILFSTPTEGHRGFLLRVRQNQEKVQAHELSQGTLLALTLLTITYLPSPPTIVGLEEPDRGLHPRLMRDLRDLLYRLSHPEAVGETRAPVQVLVTSHSPYFLDLFRDHPEEVIVAEKRNLETTFRRLDNLPNFQEILGDTASLGDAWYSGILGGIPLEH